MSSLRLPPGRIRPASACARALLLGAVLTAPAARAAGADGTADLVGVYVKALEANPQYQAAVAGFHEAAEAKPQALAKLLPQLGAGATAGELEQAVSGQFFRDILDKGSGNGISVNHRDQFYTVGYQVALTQVLFDWSLFKNYDESELKVGQAGVRLYEALDVLRLACAQDYFAVLEAQDGVRFTSAEKDAVGQLLEQAQGRFSTGMVTDSEVKQAQAEYDLSDAALIEARNSLEIGLTQLRQVTGGQPYARVKPLGAAYRAAPPEPNRLDIWLDRARAQNLPLQDKHYATEIAQKEVERQEAQRLPTLDASAKRSYAYADGGITNGIAAGNNHGLDEGVFLNVKVPLFTGGAITSAVRGAEAGLERARYEEAAALSEARHGAEVAFLNAHPGIPPLEAPNHPVQTPPAAPNRTDCNRPQEPGKQTDPDGLHADFGTV